MKTTTKLITPEIAVNILKSNTMNRKPNEAVVNNYSRLMSNGLWKEESGEAIKIANDGTLLDGQQRLLALIKSNISISFLIVEGLEKDVFDILDTGRKRSSGDIFHISGIKNGHNIAAGIGRYYNFKLRRLTNDDKRALSSSEILSMYYKSSQLWDNLLINCEKWYNKSQRLLSQSEILGIYAYLYDISDSDSFIFLNTLCTGEPVKDGEVIIVLRNKLLFHKMNKKLSLIPYIKYAYIIKAWNAYRNKINLKVLKFDSKLDNFPRAK